MNHDSPANVIQGRSDHDANQTPGTQKKRGKGKSGTREEKEDRFCKVCGKRLVGKWQRVSCSRLCSATLAVAGNVIRAKPIHLKLWPRIRIDENGCWLWQAGKDKDGYGRLQWRRRDGKTERRAHRIAWILSFGEIPEGMMILHKCDVPGCCNPIHLRLGNALDNSNDMIQKGRSMGPRGELSGHSKLTDADVIEIRRLHKTGITQRAIALQFPVGYKAVNKIVHGQRWTHVK